MKERAMSITPPTVGNSFQVPPVPVRRFTVDEYHRMLQTGILREGDPFELLEGWIVPKMTRNPPHDVALGLAEDEIGRRLPPNWFRRGQSAVTTPESEPEPDLAIVRGNRRDFVNRHPSADEMGLVAEVADTSLAQDRTVKARVYARSNISVYWIINIPDRQVEVYTDPTGPDPNPHYRQRQDYRGDDSVPLILDGREIGQILVRDLLP
jgi:Uma2 family endonuclease